MEEWKDIPGFEGYYQASSLGRIRGLPRTVIGSNGQKYRFLGEIRKLSLQNSGYLQVNLNVKGRESRNLVHRLIALTFHDTIDGKTYVNHKNGIKTDNRIENIEWCSASENGLHAYKTGLHKISEKHLDRLRKFNSETKIVAVDQYTKTGIFVRSFASCTEAAEATGFDFSSICACASMKYPNHKTCGGFVWQYSGEPFISPKARRNKSLSG